MLIASRSSSASVNSIRPDERAAKDGMDAMDVLQVSTPILF